jgi:ATP-dependent helicase/nuclease subunit B
MEKNGQPVKMTFTDQIATYIKENQLALENLTIVLPSERAKKYIASSLYKVYQKPLLSPQMITIDQWVKNNSPQTVIDKTRALILLFQIQLENAKENVDHSFDEFMSWGNILLSDFDELDRYLLDSKDLFRNLTDIKEIESWSFDQETLSEGQKRFMEFWDRLPSYYEKLNKALDQKNLCYMGKAYRFLAENIQVLFKENKDKHFLFAGFNALSKAEISIIKQLYKLGRGHVLFNADEYYLSNKNHEAGRFLNVLQQELGIKEINFKDNNLITDTKSIELISCPQVTGQAKVAGSILEKMNLEEIDNTLVLLADESLIVPVLKNLPKKIQKANITLGLPLKNTALRNWIDILFSIQENKIRFASEGVYFNDLKRIWNHPFIQAALPEEEKEKLIQTELSIIKNNAVFVALRNLNVGSIHNTIIQFIYQPWGNDLKLAIDNIRKISEQIYLQLNDDFTYEKAILYGFDRAITEFQNIIHEGIPKMSLRSFKTLFNNHWHSKSIAYHGNPMKGLQIMGLLETRLLDFKTIICLGMNEGNMPPTNSIQSMIPMDLRKYHHLPTPRDKQGLFAHHFYRLLHHCEQLYVTYSVAESTFGSTEISRYLLQIELELKRNNPNIELSKSHYTLETTENSSPPDKKIDKTTEIALRLDQLFETGISASMLNTYHSCTLDFYYKYVMGFGEEDTVEEDIKANTFGTIIHEVLEDLYGPYAQFDKEGNKQHITPIYLKPEDIDGMLANYTKLVEQKFISFFNQDIHAIKSGKNYLSFNIALQITKRFLENEKRFIQDHDSLTILYLEHRITKKLELTVHGNQKTILLKGTIDRIDKVDGKLRIIDYKSGKVNSKDVEIKHKKDKSIYDLCSKNRYFLQLVFYIYLTKELLPQEDIQEAGILSFISNNQELISIPKKHDYPNLAIEFPEVIETILEEIYNTEIPFNHEDKFVESFCNYCEG